MARNILCLLGLLLIMAGCSSPSSSQTTAETPADSTDTKGETDSIPAPKIACDPIPEPTTIGSAIPIHCQVSDDNTPSENIALSWHIKNSPLPKNTEPGDLSETTATITFTPKAAGYYALELTADNGTAKNAIEVDFSVQESLQIDCQSPAEPVEVGQTIPLHCEIHTSNGPPELQWTLLEGPEGLEAVNLPQKASVDFTPTKNPASKGDRYQFQLSGTLGEVSASDTLAFTVVNTNQPPQIHCDSTGYSALVNQTVKITCEVDDDGKPLLPGDVTLQWDIRLSPDRNLSITAPKTAAPQITPQVPGRYTLELTADDGEARSNILIDIQVESPTAKKILPLGDSITHGVGGLKSFRYDLWKKLIDANYSFDFIGNKNTNDPVNPVFPDYQGKTFDPDHQGQSGIRADTVAANLPGWLTGYTPDIVLLHLGTNDMLQDKSVNSTIEALRQIITSLREDNASVSILLASPIGYSDHNYAVGPGDIDRLETLQARIHTLATEMDTFNSPVVWVNQASGFDPDRDTADGIHPNAAGEEKMAQKWFDAIMTL